ncbi:MAG: ribbon-helix-helix protein, CopG family [Gemmatimonadaceae bacterium]
MAILYGMPNATIKATYTLDVATVRVLERVARRWGVSKSEALRRAINASGLIAADPETPLAALDELQAVAGISAASAETWSRTARAERHTPRGKRGGK